MIDIKIIILIKNLRQPGIEPGPTAWKAAILTFRLLSQLNILHLDKTLYTNYMCRKIKMRRM